MSQSKYNVHIANSAIYVCMLFYAISLFTSYISCGTLSAAHLVQVGSTATGVQLSFSVELVEQTAARVQW